MSPFTDHPAVPNPPALTEGERPCLAQNFNILVVALDNHLNGEQEYAHKLTSFVLIGWTTAFEGEVTLPLKTAVDVLNLEGE